MRGQSNIPADACPLRPMAPCICESASQCEGRGLEGGAACRLDAVRGAFASRSATARICRICRRDVDAAGTISSLDAAGTISSLLRAQRFAYTDEDELQRGVAAVLAHHGFPTEREVRLTKRDRIDLLVGRVGVEVKVGGSQRALHRQITRYMESDRVDSIVVVASRIHHALPTQIAGKPIHVVSVCAL